MAEFVAGQAVKTIQRPSRIFWIPYVLVRPRLVQLTRPALAWLTRIGIPIALWCRRIYPVVKEPRRLRHFAASKYFIRARQLLDENKPERAWRVFEKCLAFKERDFLHPRTAAICLHVGLGRMRKAIDLYRQSNAIRMARPATSDTMDDRYCVLDSFWTSVIGHAAQIDYVVKLRMLEGYDPNDTILYVPRIGEVANRFLVEQWRPYVRLITDPHELPFSEEYASARALDFFVPGLGGPGRYYLWELAAQTYRRWAADGRKPLLQLAEDVQDRGWKALASVGVPRDAWFVGLHVREPHYRSYHRDLHYVLNASLEDYLPAIEEITQRGGWVIRMGDPSMTPTPPLPNLLDYCHSTIRSDWMDVFLAATSRFFIGTASGVCYIPQNYGVPCLMTNWWPPAQRPWHAGDIFVPKILRRSRDGRILSLDESLAEPFGYCNSASHLQERHGVTVQSNHPDDIRAAVIEILERMEGRPNYSQSDLAIRARAQEIYALRAMRLYDSPGAFGSGALARDFLRRHPSFVGT